MLSGDQHIGKTPDACGDPVNNPAFFHEVFHYGGIFIYQLFVLLVDFDLFFVSGNLDDLFDRERVTVDCDHSFLLF